MATTNNLTHNTDFISLWYSLHLRADLISFRLLLRVAWYELRDIPPLRTRHRPRPHPRHRHGPRPRPRTTKKKTCRLIWAGFSEAAVS